MKVSIFMFCKDAAGGIHRAVDSILAQTYENIEIIVQDGASTDGTLDVLRSYGDRIKLVSEPDSGPEEGFWRALNRCTGDIIGSCLADEELLPNAVEVAVREFSKSPDLGALIGTGYYADAKGEITGMFQGGEGDFNIVNYLILTYCPLFAASFFSRRALLNIGLGRDDWTLKCLEVEIWCRLATDWEIEYIPEPLAKYVIHGGQLSNYAAQIISNLDARLELVEKLFSSRGFFHGHDAMKYYVSSSQCQGMLHHLNVLSASRSASADIDSAKSEIVARIEKIKAESVRFGVCLDSPSLEDDFLWKLI
ncbi:MAG: glycosyltransferase, partial [Deltaproteobacteria bacterium]|nr:glycosyltransferase [Deltaproteobacteria bacterium]